MTVQLLTLGPAVASMIWAILIKLRQEKYADSAFLAMSAICLLVNALLVYRMIVSDIGVGLHIVQMAACSCIIPMAYTYFSRQLGRSRNKTTVVMLWVLAALSFVPNVIIRSPFQPLEYPDTPLKPFALYVVSHGDKIFAIYMGDAAVALQALLTMVMIVPFTIKLRRSGLRFNPKIYAFGIWWILAIAATVQMSGMTYADLRSSFGEWFYFSVYSLLIIAINVLIILKFDLNSIRTSEGETVENIDIFLSGQYKTMAEEMKALVVDGELYCDADCSVELLVEKLHTNRTYFAQMMTSEFGITFPEYITELRISRVEKLLRTSALSISEIAFSCGYTDAGYMSRKFKERHGISPTAYRRNQ